MGLWIGFWAGLIPLSGPFDPMDWHLRELLFGYGGAALGGFLLTAVPNWTKSTPLSGIGLAALVALWVAARLTGLIDMPMLIPLILDWVYLAMLLIRTARDVLAAQNKRNMPVLGIIALFLIADVITGWQSLTGQPASSGYGPRLGIAVLILLIGLIGGRIIPTFTRNWLRARNSQIAPATFGPLDQVVMALTAIGLIIWVFAPEMPLSGPLLIVIGAAHMIRLSRWQAHSVTSEPLLFTLHLGYCFVPLGFVLIGFSNLAPSVILPVAGLHAWSAGAIGTMTVTVMARAILGHSGRALQATPFDRIILILIPLAALVRIIATLPSMPADMLHISAGLWILGYLMFVLRFLPIVLKPRMGR